MIISPGRRYVFVHIPKTGGTAMALALEARAHRDDILIGDTPKAKRRRRRIAGVQTRGRLWKHSSLADIDGLLPEGQLESLFAVTLVRNPWDRLVSFYHWARGQSFDHPQVRLAQALPFQEFATHATILSAFRAAPATSYMRRADGEEQCDAYIRLEHFAEDVRPFERHLGFRLALERVNPSDRDRDYRGYYSDRSAEAVAAACAEDIFRFGYRFDALC